MNGHANLADAGLNMARRVMEREDAKHILLSKRVADDLGEYEQWRPLLHDLGTCEVKHGARVSIVNLHADQVGNSQLQKSTGFLNRWPISRGGEASGTGASRTSTKPSGSTRATLTYSPSTRFRTKPFAGSQKRCESLISFSIFTPDDLDTLAYKAGIVRSEGDLPRASALLAPLHPAADHRQALEIQVYQAILERRPAPVIPRLKEILAKPDPALGYFNGELRFWLGWAQEVFLAGHNQILRPSSNSPVSISAVAASPKSKRVSLTSTTNASLPRRSAEITRAGTLSRREHQATVSTTSRQN